MCWASGREIVQGPDDLALRRKPICFGVSPNNNPYIHNP